jgi:hypothetical protein
MSHSVRRFTPAVGGGRHFVRHFTPIVTKGRYNVAALS